MNISKLARKEIQSLVPYEAAVQVDNTIRLNANESPFSSSARDFRRPLNRYPEVRPQKLQLLMADRFKCLPDQLLVTRGSSEAIDLLIRVFCVAGQDSILTINPTFEMYNHYATIQNAKNIQIPTYADNDFKINFDSLIKECSINTKIIFLCSPNNPTGRSLPRAELLKLMDASNSKFAVVVDEAYIEFSAEESVVELINKYPNLIVLRTLSKALGFAGARCGAVIGSNDVVRMLNAIQAPYALATPVIECIEDVMQSNQLKITKKIIDNVISERKYLMEAFNKLPFVKKVWPSDANFFLICVDDTELLMTATDKQNILLRNFEYKLPGCIRISIGSKKDNRFLLDVLEKLVEC
ncbi:MAG: histidinol-phosphate transaminase [Gammaproteobacteria bacterium]|nr:histidinol-phosphate transaminase [Gammaproteobacteria bacterium]